MSLLLSLSSKNLLPYLPWLPRICKRVGPLGISTSLANSNAPLRANFLPEGSFTLRNSYNCLKSSWGWVSSFSVVGTGLDPELLPATTTLPLPTESCCWEAAALSFEPFPFWRKRLLKELYAAPGPSLAVSYFICPWLGIRWCRVTPKSVWMSTTRKRVNRMRTTQKLIITLSLSFILANTMIYPIIRQISQ